MVSQKSSNPPVDQGCKGRLGAPAFGRGIQMCFSIFQPYKVVMPLIKSQELGLTIFCTYLTKRGIALVAAEQRALLS